MDEATIIESLPEVRRKLTETIGQVVVGRRRSSMPC